MRLSTQPLLYRGAAANASQLEATSAGLRPEQYRSQGCHSRRVCRQPNKCRILGNESFLERIHQPSHRLPLHRSPRLFAALSAVRRRGDSRHRLVERGVGPRLPQSRPSGVCRAVHRHSGFRMAGVQHGAGPCRAGGDGAEQLGVPERHGPPSDRLDSPRRAGSRDGVWRLPAILARLERRSHDGVRQVRRLAAPAAGRQLAHGPLLRLRGLDPARGALKRPLMSLVHNRLLAALPALLLALTPRTGSAQTALQLRWELVGDSIVAAFNATGRKGHTARLTAP
jgi:hypothetical protein